MTPSEFKRLRDQAIELHASQDGKGKVSLDAVFMALAATPAAMPLPTGRRTLRDDPPEPWFEDTLTRLKGSGQAITASGFLVAAGRDMSNRRDQLRVARWLLESGYQKRKSGGQWLYDL